jgi:hypothetical protein
LIDYVPDDCPRVLINKERVGEARHRWDDGFRFEERSRDYFWQGEADVGAEELARRLGWEVSSRSREEDVADEMGRRMSWKGS